MTSSAPLDETGLSALFRADGSPRQRGDQQSPVCCEDDDDYELSQDDFDNSLLQGPRGDELEKELQELLNGTGGASRGKNGDVEGESPSPGGLGTRGAVGRNRSRMQPGLVRSRESKLRV